MINEDNILTAGTAVRFVEDACGDLPESYLGRKGVLLGVDEKHCDYHRLASIAYKMKFDHHRKKEVIVYHDEIKVIDQ